MMQLDTRTGRLFTDDGKYLKTLLCPRRVGISALGRSAEPGVFDCSQCQRLVYDTASMSDAELQRLLKADPGACLLISATQSNLKLLDT